jgi:hypothetical protein
MKLIVEGTPKEIAASLPRYAGILTICFSTKIIRTGRSSTILARWGSEFRRARFQGIT